MGQFETPSEKHELEEGRWLLETIVSFNTGTLLIRFLPARPFGGQCADITLHDCSDIFFEAVETRNAPDRVLELFLDEVGCKLMAR